MVWRLLSPKRVRLTLFVIKHKQALYSDRHQLKLEINVTDFRLGMVLKLIEQRSRNLPVSSSSSNDCPVTIRNKRRKATPRGFIVTLQIINSCLLSSTFSELFAHHDSRFASNTSYSQNPKWKGTFSLTDETRKFLSFLKKGWRNNKSPSIVMQTNACLWAIIFQTLKVFSVNINSIWEKAFNLSLHASELQGGF